MSNTRPSHDGALDINVYLNNKKVCTSSAIYGGDRAVQGQAQPQKWETIISYTPCADAVKIKKGDKLSMDSNYDLRKHTLRPDAHSMGMGGGAGEGAEGMALATFQWAIAGDQSEKW